MVLVVEKWVIPSRVALQSAPAGSPESVKITEYAVEGDGEDIVVELLVAVVIVVLVLVVVDDVVVVCVEVPDVIFDVEDNVVEVLVVVLEVVEVLRVSLDDIVRVNWLLPS